MRGMPLSHQLTSRGSAFVESARTSPNYRLFAIAGGDPPRPGLLRMAPGENGGAAIAVELWDMPAGNFGSFMADVPAPLSIGTLQLEDGRLVKGFICEAAGLVDAQDVTAFGGWRAYLASLPK